MLLISERMRFPNGIIEIMDNTVGSINVKKLLSEPQAAYILGLFCADGYHRTSSIGLSNKDEELLGRFAHFLLDYFPKERLRIRAYYPVEVKSPKLSKKLIALSQNIVYYPLLKAKQISCHLYVNSRPLLRMFTSARKEIEKIKSKAIISYIAGRFDGDGSVNKMKNIDFRILYGNYKEAKIDQSLLKRIGVSKSSIYHYKQARTFCLYVWREETSSLMKLLLPFSVYLQKRLTSITP